MSRDHLQVRVNSTEDEAIVEAIGELDETTAPRLGTILKAICHRPDSSIVLDLRPTTHLHNCAVDALVSLHQVAAAPAQLEVQVQAGSQPESMLQNSVAHRHFSVVVWNGASHPEDRTNWDIKTSGLELRIPSDRHQVARVRRLCEQLMLLTGVDENWLMDFISAIGEAVANAVTHGSPPGSTGYALFRLNPGPLVATAEVQDFGPGIRQWKGLTSMPGPYSIRGRGLGMMNVLSDRMDIETGSGGTIVRLHKYHGLGVCPSVAQA